MKKIEAFTLAETMIVIVVLGIIATLTIPALVNKNKESVAKTKVRKAMAAYESALNKMIIENDLKSDDTLTAWAGANCVNSTNYFKKVQGDGCIFKTSDGIWWNISDIERPVISFKEINADNAATITTNANNANDKTAFVLVGRFGNDGSLRVDDLAYETANSVGDTYGNSSKAQVEKLYSLLGLKSTGTGEGNQSPFAACNGAETCVVDGITYTKMTFTNNTSNYCVETYDDFDCSYKSTTIAGDYYVAIEGYPDNYSILAHDCTGSTYSECLSNGDYYNAAEQYCGPNARLIKAAELRLLQNDESWNWSTCAWTSDVYDDASSAVAYGECAGNIKSKSEDWMQVICVGK